MPQPEILDLGDEQTAMRIAQASPLRRGHAVLRLGLDREQLADAGEEPGDRMVGRLCPRDGLLGLNEVAPDIGPIAEVDQVVGPRHLVVGFVAFGHLYGSRRDPRIEGQSVGRAAGRRIAEQPNRRAGAGVVLMPWSQHGDAYFTR